MTFVMSWFFKTFLTTNPKKWHVIEDVFFAVIVFVKHDWVKCCQCMNNAFEEILPRTNASFQGIFDSDINQGLFSKES